MCYSIFSCQGVTDLFALLDVDGSGIITRTWVALRFCHGGCESRRIYTYLYIFLKNTHTQGIERRHFQINPASRSGIYWRPIAPWLRLQRVIGTATDTLWERDRYARDRERDREREREREPRIRYPAVHMRLSLPSQEYLFARNPGVCSSVIEDDSQDEGWCAPAMFELGWLLVDITAAVETAGIWICLASAIFVQRFNFPTIWNINLLCLFWGSSSNYLGSLGSLSTCCLMVKLPNTFETRVSQWYTMILPSLRLCSNCRLSLEALERSILFIIYSYLKILKTYIQWKCMRMQTIKV